MTTTRRLTVGWDQPRPATLSEHLDRYGPQPALPPGGLIAEVISSGLTGRGGAAFPTGIKLRTVASGRGRPVVVANGMESEPASEKDQALLCRAPHLMLDGAALAAAAIGAQVVYVCVPREREQVLTAVAQAITEREAAGHDQVEIQLHGLPDGYVSSEETALVHWLNGGAAKPTATPPRPFTKGVAGQPTLIDNVETLAHVALIARSGAAWFRLAGLPDAPGTMLATISGAVAEPGVYEIEVGTPVGTLLAMSGAPMRTSGLLIGGYFGTWHRARDVAGLPLAASALQTAGASPGAGVLVVLPPGTCGLSETARVLAWLAGQGAGQCGPCVFGLPAIADDFAQLACGRPQGPLLDRLDRRLATVTGRGACRHPDGAVRLARSALSAFAADVHAHATRRSCLLARDGLSRPVLPVPSLAREQAWQ